MKFEELDICLPLKKALFREWFDTSTEIQKKIILASKSWNDILAFAKTWSWKTLAFVLPVLDKMYKEKKKLGLEDGQNERIIKTLVLAPTRELAEQIWEVFKPYCTNVNFKHIVIFGWVNDFHQKKNIKKWVDILVATPWRLIDLAKQGALDLSFVENLILDESDRMIDMWNWQDIRNILKLIKWKKQTILLSATMKQNLKKLAKEITKNAEEIVVDKIGLEIPDIVQQLHFVESTPKRKYLKSVLGRKWLDSVLIFVRTRLDAYDIFSYVKKLWIKCDTIHKDRKQNQRKRAINNFKNWDIKVLIATDIASRWIDINNLSCVINYDIPENSDDYIHRIGRTARAGKKWLSISIADNNDKEKVKRIEKKLWKKLLRI